MKKPLISIFLLIAVVGAILVYRAQTVFQDHQLEPAAGLTAVRLDEQLVIERFSRSLTFPTISYDDRSNFDAAAFRNFRDYLETAYPLVHQHADLTVINGHSLVFHFPGSDLSLEPVLWQSAYFRTHNKDAQIDGLYFVGAGTHPGAGIPGVVGSAKATAGIILDDLGERKVA